MVTIPAGTKVTVDSGTAWHKLQISAARCECCGVHGRVSRVNVQDLMPLGTEPLSDTQRPEGT